MKYSITYEVITAESAENGDAAERGYKIENESARIKEVIAAARNLGIFVESGGRWWHTVDADHGDYRSGEETYYSLHVPALERKGKEKSRAIFTRALRYGR